MRKLNDKDIADMIGAEFTPENNSAKEVCKSLHLSTRIPKPEILPAHPIIDFHNHTEEEAWTMLTQLVDQRPKTATVITGASGILKIKFQQWVKESIISPYILSCRPLNNGSYELSFHKNK